MFFSGIHLSKEYFEQVGFKECYLNLNILTLISNLCLTKITKLQFVVDIFYFNNKKYWKTF